MGRSSKLTPETTQTVLDVIAAGGTRAVAAEAAGVHRGTIYEWLRRGTEDANATQTALDPDDYTSRELRALGKAAQIPGYARLRKAELAAAITAKPSEYSDFSDSIKKAEAEAEAEWLNGVARIARGAGIATTVHRGARRRRERPDPDHTHRHRPRVVADVRVAARTPASGTVGPDGAASVGAAGTLDPEEIIARGEAQMRVIDGGQK